MLRTFLRAAMAAALPSFLGAQQSPILRDLKIFGYVQFQGEFGDSTDSRFPREDRFFLRRARLAAHGVIAKDFDVRIMFDGAPGLAPEAESDARLVEAWAKWRRHPEFTVQVGQFKSPFTYEESHSASLLYTIERSLVVDRLKPSRQIGVMTSGVVRERATWAAGAFNGTSGNTNINDGETFLYVGRLTATAWMRRSGEDFLNLGASGLTSRDDALQLGPEFGVDLDPSDAEPDDVFRGRRASWGVDMQLQAGRGQLWLEYLSSRLDPANDLPAPSFTAAGWYALGTWYLLPRRVQLVARYDEFDPHDTAAGDRTNSVTAGVNWFVTGGHDLKLQVADLATRREAGSEWVHRLLLRTQLMFGVL